MIGKIGENDKDILTDYIEILKLGKMSSKSYRYNVDKKCDERDRIDMVDDKKSDERYQIGKIQAKEIDL